MEKPLISLFGPAIRPQNWLRLYDNISDSSVPFEIVFVGPNEPDYTLPDNFRYIKSNVKPVQCAEAAARSTKGEFIMNTVDDLEFVTKDALGKLYNEYTAYSEDKLILSSRFMTDGIDASLVCHHYPMSDPLVVPVGGLITRKLYMER